MRPIPMPAAARHRFESPSRCAFSCSSQLLLASSPSGTPGRHARSRSPRDGRRVVALRRRRHHRRSSATAAAHRRRRRRRHRRCRRRRRPRRLCGDHGAHTTAARARRGLVVAVARAARQIHGPITLRSVDGMGRGFVAARDLGRASCSSSRRRCCAGRRRSATRRRCSARWHRHRRRSARQRSRRSRSSTPSRRSRPPRARAPRRRTAAPPTSSRRCGRAQMLARRAAPAVPRRAVERLRVGPLPPPVDLQPRLPAVCQLRQERVAAGGGARGGGGAAAAAGGAPLSVVRATRRSRAASSAASRTCSRPSSSPPSAPSASASLILGARAPASRPSTRWRRPAAASGGAPTPTTRPARGRSGRCAPRATGARARRRRAAGPLVRATALRPLRGRARGRAAPRARRRAPPLAAALGSARRLRAAPPRARRARARCAVEHGRRQRALLGPLHPTVPSALRHVGALLQHLLTERTTQLLFEHFPDAGAPPPPRAHAERKGLQLRGDPRLYENGGKARGLMGRPWWVASNRNFERRDRTTVGVLLDELPRPRGVPALPRAAAGALGGRSARRPSS